jgi:hypothetical protein
MSLVIAVNKANAIYSYSSYDVQPVAGKIPMTSARTGVATILKQIGPVYVLGLATAGGAATSTATTGSFAGGGAVVYRYKTSPWTGIFEVQVVSNTGRTIRLGIGRTF